MQKPSDPRVYGSPLNQESVTRVTPEVLHQVAALSKLCTVSPASGSPSSGATSSGESGIIAAYSAETLANFCSLKGSRLIVWGTGNQARAAALYHLSIQHTPAWLSDIAADFVSCPRLGYAHFVLVHPDFRGVGGGYNVLMETALRDASPFCDELLALVRPDNARALAAHTKRGFQRTGIFRQVPIGQDVVKFEFLMLSVAHGPGIAAQRLAALSKQFPARYALAPAL